MDERPIIDFGAVIDVYKYFRSVNDSTSKDMITGSGTEGGITGMRTHEPIAKGLRCKNTKI